MIERTANTTIHPQDFIFQFIARKPEFQGEGKAIARYMARGLNSAMQLRAIVLDHIDREDFSLLEFAAGYGCITRHLKDVLPQAKFVACDIHDEAVAFITYQFGIPAIGSVAEPNSFSSSLDFDVVFALSFFSHIPKSTWTRWLRTLVRQVKPGGLLIFTTHGLQSGRLFPDYCADADGFWFKPVSEQDDIDTASYGSTVTTFDYVYRQIVDSDARLIRFQEAMWWTHQDLYVLRR